MISLQEIAVRRLCREKNTMNNDSEDKGLGNHYNTKINITDTIKIGDITGPCGNNNCALAQQVKAYIRKQDAYKKVSLRSSPRTSEEGNKIRTVCGKCDCKDDKWHRDRCPEKYDEAICSKCGGVSNAGEICTDRLKNLYDTGMTPKGSRTS